MGTGDENGTAGQRRERRTVAGLDPRAATVHDAVSAIRGAREVFERHGIDACCGGELPLARAAELHEVELGRLMDALEAAGHETG